MLARGQRQQQQIRGHFKRPANGDIETFQQDLYFVVEVDPRGRERWGRTRLPQVCMGYLAVLRYLTPPPPPPPPQTPPPDARRRQHRKPPPEAGAGARRRRRTPPPSPEARARARARAAANKRFFSRKLNTTAAARRADAHHQPRLAAPGCAAAFDSHNPEFGIVAETSTRGRV